MLQLAGRVSNSLVCGWIGCFHLQNNANNTDIRVSYVRVWYDLLLYGINFLLMYSDEWFCSIVEGDELYADCLCVDSGTKGSI